MIKKTGVIKLIGILAIAIPIVFYQGIPVLVLGVMWSGSLIVVFLTLIAAVFYLYTSISLIKGKFSIGKLVF